jgi:hypothetical protein
MSCKENAFVFLVEHLDTSDDIIFPYLDFGDAVFTQIQSDEVVVLGIRRMCANRTVFGCKLQILATIVYVVNSCDRVIKVEISWLLIIVARTRFSSFNEHFSQFSLKRLLVDWSFGV